jgi:hypothetical protein
MKSAPFPDVGQGVNDTVRLGHPGLQPDPLSRLLNRVDFPVYDFEPLFVVGPVDGADMDDIVEVALAGSSSQKPGHIPQGLSRHRHGEVSAPLRPLLTQGAIGKRVLEPVLLADWCRSRFCPLGGLHCVLDFLQAVATGTPAFA